MLVSIITPNFNSSSFIHATKQSILDQTYSNWEWLVVDDGSTDDSTEIIQEFSKQDNRIHLLERGKGLKGASTCRNVGIENAKGDYLFFLDADDILAPHCLESRLRTMSEHPDLDFGVFNMGMFQNEIGDVKEVINLYSEKPEGYLEMFLSYKLPWQTSCPIWKSSFLRENDIRFSEKYLRLQDPEFHAKVLLKYAPQFKVFKEHGPDCYYRLPNGIKKSTESSLNNTTVSTLLFYSEINDLIKEKHLEKQYGPYLDQFVINIFHSQLFYTRLNAIKPVTNLYGKMNATRPITNLSKYRVLLFAFFNYTGLTFVKGAGITRLWNSSS